MLIKYTYLKYTGSRRITTKEKEASKHENISEIGLKLLEHPFKTLRSISKNQDFIMSLEKVTSTIETENKVVFLKMDHRLA